MTKKKEQSQPEAPRKKVQVHVFHRLENGRVAFLILQRTARKGSIWQCVTGNVEPGENLEASARREVAEETGLTLKDAGVGEVWRYEFSKGGEEFEEHVFGFEAAGADVGLSHEHQAWRWVDAGEAMALIHYDGIREGLRRVLKALEREPKAKREPQKRL